jgi:hypothetical protein
MVFPPVPRTDCADYLTSTEGRTEEIFRWEFTTRIAVSRLFGGRRSRYT